MRRLPFSVRRAASLRRRTRLVHDERGFSLIEAVMAMVVFAIIAAALVGLLESAIAANGLGRQKTIAQQLAQDQVEWIRKLDYTTEVGIPGGNPNGIIPATTSISVKGAQATMTTEVDWVDDPTPASYSTAANYKRVTVTVRSNRNNTVLTSIVTYVAPPGRAPFGGLNNAIINVNVQDMGLVTNNALAGVLINLTTGPSAPLSDTTDSTGLVTFPALTANPATGSQAYYDLVASKSGYTTYVTDRSPNTAAHLQVAPSETASRTIRMYKGATINVALINAGGSPYTLPATIKLTSPLLSQTQTFTTSSGSLPVTTFAGDPVVPGDFTARAFTTTGLCADPVAKYVPDNYPTVLSSTITLQLLPCPSGTLVVNATQLGGPAAGAAITISGGPNDFTPITQTANASGQTTFTSLPSGTDPYTISVTDAPGQVTATGSATVTTGATTTATIALGNPPMGSISALVQWLSTNVSGATVTVTGGPYNVSLSGGPTTGSGTVLFSNNVPAGTGYTVTATKNGQTKAATGVAVTAGSTTPVTLAMPTGTINVTATWLSLAAGSANVSISGGPNGGGPYTGTTSVGGTVAIVVPATTASFPYTVTVTKNGGSGTASVATLAGGGSAAAAVTMGGIGTITVNTATWVGLPAGTATVTITNGPNGGSYTGTTNSSGVSGAISVPATTSSWPYLVTVTKAGGSGTATVNTVTNLLNTNAAVALTQTKTFTITIQRGGVAVASGTSINLSITGGPNGTAGAAPAYTFTRVAGASGVLPTVTVPLGTAGATYTIKANLTTCGVSASNRSGSIAGQANTGANTNVTLNMTTTACPFSPLP